MRWDKIKGGNNGWGVGEIVEVIISEIDGKGGWIVTFGFEDWGVEVWIGSKGIGSITQGTL